MVSGQVMRVSKALLGASSLLFGVCYMPLLISYLIIMCIRWFSDNQNVVRIIKIGSRQPQLQEIALRIFTLSVNSHIHLQPEWIPRELNEQADYLSRIIDLDDWMLNPYIFSQQDAIWGPHTVDRFAS